MKTYKKIAIAALVIVVGSRFNSIIFGFTTLFKLLSLPPQQIPELYSRDMKGFLITLILAVVLLMVIFPKKEKYLSRRDKEIGKIRREAYSKGFWPHL